MATDPFSWAARIGEQGYADKQNAQAYDQNALMQIFQEEAARQRPYTQLPVQMAQHNMQLAASEPYQIAREQRALENDMTLRRFYAENPIPRADADAEAVMGGGVSVGPNGEQIITIGGKQFIQRQRPDGTIETVLAP